MKRVLGLEVHAQIATATKLFSRAKIIDEATEPNMQVSWVDAGMPGSLPVANEQAIQMALRTSLALGMKINEVSVFDRKHYFYQDLPLGYQITQFYQPIGLAGVLHCSFGSIRINRLHIEADAGKTIYEDGSILVDLNRVGVPLMEIVTEPDFESAEQVVEFLKELRAILLTIGTCKCNMDEGNLRVDVNLSLREEGQPLGTRVEIKNLNSFRFIAKAIEYEASVQAQTLKSGGRVLQETKLFDSKLGVTKSIRDKEDFADYRYFADPDLLPVKLSSEEIESARASLPKLPQQIRAEYSNLGIAKEQCYTLTEHPIRIKFFDCLLQELDTSKQQVSAASNWVSSELIGKLRRDDEIRDRSSDLQGKANMLLEEFVAARPDFAYNFARIISLCESNQISRTNAKALLDQLIEKPCDVEILVKEHGYADHLNDDEILVLIEQTIKSMPDEIAKYKAGKVQVVMFFVGAIMKAAKGKCDPTFVKEECLKVLDNL